MNPQYMPQQPQYGVPGPNYGAPVGYQPQGPPRPGVPPQQMGMPSYPGQPSPAGTPLPTGAPRPQGPPGPLMGQVRGPMPGGPAGMGGPMQNGPTPPGQAPQGPYGAMPPSTMQHQPGRGQMQMGPGPMPPRPMASPQPNSGATQITNQMAGMTMSGPPKPPVPTPGPMNSHPLKTGFPQAPPAMHHPVNGTLGSGDVGFQGPPKTMGPPPMGQQQQLPPPQLVQPVRPPMPSYTNGPSQAGIQYPPAPGAPLRGPPPPLQSGMAPPATPSYPGQQASMPPPPTAQNQQYPPSPANQYQSAPQGIYQSGGQMGGFPQQNYPVATAQPSAQPAQQSRRLDPDHMPSPIQVIQDDQRHRSGVFITNQKGLVPPLVTTSFVVQDQGNASARFIRSTMYNVPSTIDMMKQTAVPFGLVISPLAELVPDELPPPIVNLGELGPVRCIRCKAYMCPFMQFIDGGRRFQCVFCKATSEVPPEYFQHLDHTGQRMDKYERPELCLGTYEMAATKDYCRNNVFPKPPAFIFLIDVSYNNIKSGMVHLLCNHMKEILRLLPKDQPEQEKSNMKVGFITYNNTVHFYNIKECLTQPQMMVVGDVQDMFMPLLDGFLCDASESEAVIDSLMEQIPAMFADTRETETILAPAIQAGLEALKASECAGKLLVFHSSLPIAEAPGKLKNRDDRKVLGTEKEKTVLAPQTTFYNNLGQECVGAGCSVDMFVFNNAFIDIATIGQVCRLTGGQLYKYTYFQADLDGQRLIADIKNNVSRNIAFDAIMRVRTSTGVRATDFYGNFFMSNTTDMELASVDCDKAVAVEIKHDDKLTEEDGVYIQVALLYTSSAGQRRLRILNLSLNTCSQMADLYRNCELDTLMNFFGKQVVSKLLEQTPKNLKDALISRCAQILACYRKNCASPSSAGQLILPECMKLLPLYVNCVLKCDAVSGGSDMTVDDRAFVMHLVQIMDVPSSMVYFYPRLLPLHDIDVNSDSLPDQIRCSADKLRDDGVYLLENGIHLFLWTGLNVGMNWVQDVFGVHSAAQIDIDRTSLPELDNPLSLRVRTLVEQVRQRCQRYMRLTLVRQRDKMEMVFKHFLVEDRGMDGSPSYIDFLCHMHKEIRSQLS